MEKKPLVSIIVPIYNVENYLSKCLDSLVNQTMQNIEILCVDDGSHDNSLLILKEYASRDKRITILKQPNSGVSIARNNALKHVNGDFFMFVDSDDWLDIETCEVVYNFAMKDNADCLMFSYTKEFKKYSVVSHVFNKDYFVWDTNEIKQKFHRRLFGPIGDELKEPQNTDILISSWMQLFRSDKFRNILFENIRDIGTFEDGLYQMVLYNMCKRFVYIDRPYYHYRKTNESSITTRYKADLLFKWLHLYDIIQSYIDKWDLPAIYHEALDNRIAIGIIGLGLNQTHSNDSIIQGSKHMKDILATPKIKHAVSKLDTSKMPVSWKIFFFLAKHNYTVILFMMLKLIEYLRTNRLK